MRKKWIAAFLMGACALAPRASRAEIWTGGPERVSAMEAQTQALAAVLRKFTSSTDANPGILKNELPTLNELSKLDSNDLNNRVIACPVADAVMDSIKQLERSFSDDFYNYRDPSDALVKAKKWGMLNRMVQSPAFSWWFSDKDRVYIRRGADFYQSWLSKEKEDRRQELEQSMHGIELALNGNLPAQLAEAEIPAVDASGSPAGNRGQAALAAPVPNPATLSEAQALIEELKRFPNSDREEEIAQKLIALVRQNPRDEALQMAIAQGVIGLEQYIGGHPGSYIGVLTDLENDLTFDSAYKLVEAELHRELHLGDPATLAELEQLNKEDDGQMAARAQLLSHRPKAFRQASALINKLGQTYEESAKDQLAHRLIDLMRLNPTNKALQIMVAHGIVNNYHEDRINHRYHRYQILRDARHAPYFHKARLILWDAFMIEEAKTLSWWQKLLRYAQDWF